MGKGGSMEKGVQKIKGGKLFILTFLIFIFFASAKEGESIDTILIKDMAGRIVHIPKGINRIVAIGPGALRLVVYLNSFDKVVGVEEAEKGKWTPAGRPYTLAIQQEVKKIPAIAEGGPGKLPDFEKMMMVKPDVIFIIGMEPSQVENMQEKTKIPAFVLNYGEIGVFREEAIESLKILGKVLNREERAREIIGFIDRCRFDLENRTKGIRDSSKPTVYVGGIGYKGQHGITSTEAGFLPLKMINAKNVVDELGRSGHLFIDKEKLMIWNPDVIFLDMNGFNMINVDYSKNPTFYRILKAVKNGSIFSILPYNYYNTNIEIAIADAYFIGKILYPDRFIDIDPQKKADEVISFFVGIPLYEQIKKEFKGFGRVVFEEGRIDVK